MPARFHALTAYRRDGPRTSAELQRLLGVSQPTVSRLIAAAGDAIVRIGQARAARYALARRAFGLGDSLPLYQVDPRGMVARLGALRRSGERGILYRAFRWRDRAPWWMLGAAGLGYFEGLPYFLDDLRPQGFLGRPLARGFARAHGYPEAPRNWTEEQIGFYRCQRGADLPGNLLVGDHALNEFQYSAPSPIADRSGAYPAFVDRAAGGRPGWRIRRRRAAQVHRLYRRPGGHVIVKFSPQRTSPESIR